MFIIMMIRPKFSEALLLFRIIYARMSLEDIEQPFKEVFKEARNDGINLEYSIANPLFGHVFRATGCLENVRFFSSELKTEYDREMRDYGLDKSEDSLTNLLIHLFPSHTGTLNTLRGVNLNFTNRFFIENKDYKSGKGSRASSLEIRTENIKMLGETFIKLLRDGTSTEVEMPDPRSPHPYKLFEYYVFLSSNAPGLDDINLKLLAIHAYALDVINTVDELKAYLKPISDGLKEVGNVEHLVLDEEQEKLFNKLYANPFKFPYSNTRQPVSNSSIPVYHRKTKTFDPKERFSDCADIVILHLCNCLFYNKETRECSFDFLKSKKDVSAECSKFIEFYKDYDYKPFEITYEMRKDWSKVVQGLNNNKVFECQGGFNPYIIYYIKEEHRNEVKAGIINIMSVLSKICDGNSIFEGIMTSGDPISKDSITEKLSTFLNEISNKNTVIEISGKFTREFIFNGIRDLAGDFEIKFNFKSPQNSMRMLLGVQEKHASLTYISMKSDEQLGTSTPIDIMGITGNKLLLSLLNRFVMLLNDKDDKIEDYYPFGVLYNQGTLKTNEQKRQQLIYLFEFVDKKRDIDPEKIISAIENIVKSANLQDPVTRRLFKPFFPCIGDLFATMRNDDIFKTWLSLYGSHSVMESYGVKNIWNYFIEARFKRITKLSLSFYSYTIDDIAGILHIVNKKLIDLQLRDFPRESQEALEMIEAFLIGNTRLSRLSLSNNELKLEHIAVISNAIKSGCMLRVLDFSDNDLRAEGIKPIADFLAKDKFLRSLNISYNGLEVEGLEQIIDALKESKSLKSLDISGNDLGIEGAKLLAGFLIEDKSLRSLNVSHNNLGAEGLGQIIDALKENKSLKSLDISGNDIDAEILAGFLIEDKSLKSLNISSNNLGVEGLRQIIDALTKNESLRLLNISKNNFGVEGAKLLSDFLKENRSLKSLSIQNIGLEDEGTKLIADALKSNTCLITLNISSNGIGSEGVKEIASAIKVNKSLKRLNIEWARLDGAGAGHIADALNESTHLETLSIEHTNLGDDGAKLIANALKNNKYLKALNIASNCYGSVGAELLYDAIFEKQSLKLLTISDKDVIYEMFGEQLISRKNKFSVIVLLGRL